MKRWLVMFGLVSLALAVGVAIWPADRESLEVNGELFWIDQMELQTELTDGSNRFIFAIEHDLGNYRLPEDPTAPFFAGLYCGLERADPIKDMIASADSISILVRTYNWKIGNFGTWNDFGFTYDTNYFECSATSHYLANAVAPT